MRPASLPEGIRTENLFGDSGDLPDVVHCETIEVRSRLHDWRLAPHRHPRLHQALLLSGGHGRMTLDGVARDLPPGSLVNVPRGVVHGYEFRPGTAGWVITLASEMLEESLRAEEGLLPLLSRPAVLRAGPEQAAAMEALGRAHAARDFGRAQILRGLSMVLLGRIAQAIVAESGAGEDARPAPLAGFETLLEEHFRDHWRVADYARALGMSATHLSRLARAATGRPASALIAERVLREARRHLVYTSLPVAGIAYALGFEDPAHFSRHFARGTGLPPGAFRARVQGGQPPSAASSAASPER